MSVHRLGDSLYRVMVRIRVQGAIKHRQATVTGTRDDARAKEVEIKRGLRENAGHGSFKVFADVLGFYLARHEVGRSQSLFDLLTADLGGVKLSELAERFDRWFLLLRQSKAKRTGRPIAAGTVNRYLAWSRAALNFAVKNRLIDRNPIEHIEPLKEVALDVSLTEEQERRLLNVIDTKAPHLSAAVRFMIQVPCRVSEVVNMRRDDVDLFSNTIRVRNGTTKNDAGIDKPIPPPLVAYIRAIPAESEYVFYRQEGERYLPLGDFKKAWRTCTRLAGLSGLRVHSLRHVAATRLIDNGTPEQVVMTVAGWKTNMLRTYYHRNPKKALELIRFEPQCEQSREQSSAGTR